MEKTEFKYRNNKAIILWYLFLAAPVILLKELVVDRLFSASAARDSNGFGANDILYLVIGTVLTIGIIYYLWKHVLDHLPGVQRKGLYWLENGIVCMQLGDKTYRWDNVEELMLQDRDSFSAGIRLGIRKNAQESIWLLSEPVSSGSEISDTVFGAIFLLVLRGNPALEQEQDAFRHPIPYSYQKKK